MQPEVENGERANDFGKLERQNCNNEDDDERENSVSGCFAAATALQRANRSFSRPDHADIDAIGRHRRTEPVNLTTSTDGEGPEEGVDGPAFGRSAGARSQYHSIQQLSQSGHAGGTGGSLSGSETAGCGQTWFGCGRFPVDEGDDDTLQVLRSLLRRYDSCATALDDSWNNESDEMASGRVSNSDLRDRGSLSGDDDGDSDEGRSPIGQQVLLRRSPSTTTLQAKRARVENIVSNIRVEGAPTAATAAVGCSGQSTCLEEHGGRRRSKRKQTVPQQHDCATFDNDDLDRRSTNGDFSDYDDYDYDDRRSTNGDFSDDDDYENLLTVSPTVQPDNDDQEIRRQLRVVQLRLEDMYAKYVEVLRSGDLRLSASRRPDDDSSSHDSTVDRLTSFLKTEVSHVVDGLVDRLIERFLKKQQHSAGRQSAPEVTDDRPRLDVTRLPLLVFPPPPPLFPPFPFPVGGGDILSLRRAYVDALIHPARTTASCTADSDVASLNYGNSISGCTAVTSSHAAATVDSCSPMSIMTSRCLLPTQQLVQPRFQVQRTLRPLVFVINFMYFVLKYWGWTPPFELWVGLTPSKLSDVSK